MKKSKDKKPMLLGEGVEANGIGRIRRNAGGAESTAAETGKTNVYPDKIRPVKDPIKNPEKAPHEAPGGGE